MSGARRPRAAEFFAGIGLVRAALERSGIDVAWANDIEPCKQRVYQENFGDRDFVLADIRTVWGPDLPDVDLATASFPCTDLSLAGNRRGIRAGESSMFWEFARVLDEMGERRPPVILLENVPGFASSHGGRDLREALGELNRLGYSCDVFTIDAAHFVPQSRQRMFIVGAQAQPAECVVQSEDGLRRHRWPLVLPPTSPATLADVVQRLSSANPRWWDADRTARFLASLSPTQRARLDALRKGTRTWRTAYRRTRNGVATWEIRSDHLAGCLRTARGGSSKQAVVEAGRGNVRVRWMTAREYATLQGAPNHKFRSVSENKAMFGFGDAVCVPVIAWIAQEYLVPLLLQEISTAA
jgi:DNA (cytosine-5)-methyltransferase 1